MARRFRLDYQTFQFVVLLGVPSLAVYAYGKYTQKSPEELEQHLKTNYSAEVMAARRNNNALKDMFAKRAESGAFDDETEEKLDRVLRGGRTKGRVQRINHDNVDFHAAKRSENDEK